MSLRSFRRAVLSVLLPSSLSDDKDSVEAGDPSTLMPMTEKLETVIVEGSRRLQFVAAGRALMGDKAKYVPTGIVELDGYLGGGLRAGELTTFLIHDVAEFMPWLAEIYRNNILPLYDANLVKQLADNGAELIASVKSKNDFGRHITLIDPNKFSVVWLPQSSGREIADLWSQLPKYSNLAKKLGKPIIILRVLETRIDPTNINNVWLSWLRLDRGVIPNTHTVIEALPIASSQRRFCLIKHPVIPVSTYTEQPVLHLDEAGKEACSAIDLKAIDDQVKADFPPMIQISWGSPVQVTALTGNVSTEAATTEREIANAKAMAQTLPASHIHIDPKPYTGLMPSLADFLLTDGARPVTSPKVEYVPTGILELDAYLGGGLRVGEVTTFLVNDVVHWMPWFAKLYKDNLPSGCHGAPEALSSIKGHKDYHNNVSLMSSKFIFIWLPQHTLEARQLLWDHIPKLHSNLTKPIILLRAFAAGSHPDMVSEGMEFHCPNTYWADVRAAKKGVFKDSHAVIECFAPQTLDAPQTFRMQILQHPVIHLSDVLGDPASKLVLKPQATDPIVLTTPKQVAVPVSPIVANTYSETIRPVDEWKLAMSIPDHIRSTEGAIDHLVVKQADLPLTTRPAFNPSAFEQINALLGGGYPVGQTTMVFCNNFVCQSTHLGPDKIHPPNHPISENLVHVCVILHVPDQATLMRTLLGDVIHLADAVRGTNKSLVIFIDTKQQVPLFCPGLLRLADVAITCGYMDAIRFATAPLKGLNVIKHRDDESKITLRVPQDSDEPAPIDQATAAKSIDSSDRPATAMDKFAPTHFSSHDKEIDRLLGGGFEIGKLTTLYSQTFDEVSFRGRPVQDLFSKALDDTSVESNSIRILAHDARQPKRSYTETVMRMLELGKLAKDKKIAIVVLRRMDDAGHDGIRIEYRGQLYRLHWVRSHIHDNPLTITDHAVWLGPRDTFQLLTVKPRPSTEPDIFHADFSQRTSHLVT